MQVKYIKLIWPFIVYIVIFKSLWVNNRRIKTQNMLIWICIFLPDAVTSTKTVSTVRTEKKFWEVAQCLYIDIMVNNKWNIPKFKDNFFFFKYSKCHSITHGIDFTGLTRGARVNYGVSDILYTFSLRLGSF